MGYIQANYKESELLEIKSLRGNYDAVLKNISFEDAKNLKNNLLVKNLGLYKELHNYTINIDNKEKEIKIYTVDKEGLKEIFGPLINLLSGKLPEKNNEVLIDSVGRDFLNINVGDTLKLGQEEYKIVGVYDKTNSIQPYTIEIISNFNEKKNLNNVNAAFNVIGEKNKVDIITKVANSLEIYNNKEKELIFNDLYFYYYDGNNYSIDNILSKNKLQEISLYSSILILTVFMTYSFINISIRERIEQFSILRCIGATTNKIRILLIRESILLSIFSIIPGIILGQLICFLLSSLVLTKIFTNPIPYKIYPQVINIVVLLSIINIFLSTIIPVIKVGKISPVEGLKSANILRFKSKKKNSKIIMKIWGYNGLLAYKNIRGNNKSFIVTTIISILILTIFIVFSGYSSSLNREYNKEQNESKDASLSIDVRYREGYEDVFADLNKYKEEIEDLEVINESYGSVYYSVKGVFENIQFNKWIKNQYEDVVIGEKNIEINNKKLAYSDIINLIVMDDNSLESILPYVSNKNLKLEDFKENGVIMVERAVNKNLVSVEKEPLFNLKENEVFTMKIDKNNTDVNIKNINKEVEDLYKNGVDINLKYLGYIDEDNIKVRDSSGFSQRTTLIVSEDFYNNNQNLLKKNRSDKFLESNEINITVEVKDNKNRENSLKVIQNYANKIEAYYYDIKIYNEKIESSLLATSTIVYLVLFLTVIVGGLNLINNKYINIKNRGKEIGTLLAIGINKKRLKKILMLEGITQWFISAVISLILSYIILNIMFKMMIYFNTITISNMPIASIIIGCTILLIINILGVYLPIRKLKYTSTTDLIRNKE